MNLQFNLSDFDIPDFNRRWQAARVSAIGRASKIAGVDLSQNPSSSTEVASNQTFDLNNEASLLERYLLTQIQPALDSEAPSLATDAVKEVPKDRMDVLLRAVFENSRLLAMSLSKSLGVSFELEDFRALLEQSTIPCFHGQWESRRTAQVLNRKGCGFSPKSGSSACDYWREALDGLIMGLGENERLARHACARHAVSVEAPAPTSLECIDVIFVDNPGHSFKADSLAWGPIPDEMSETLVRICSEFSEKMQTAVQIKGLNEGVLYFEFHSETDVGCSGGNLLSSTFQRKIQAVYPSLRIHEVSPRAVLGAET